MNSVAAHGCPPWEVLCQHPELLTVPRALDPLTGGDSPASAALPVPSVLCVEEAGRSCRRRLLERAGGTQADGWPSLSVQLGGMGGDGAGRG